MGERDIDDERACRAILRAGSKSFYAASLLLPTRVRHDAGALYAFCRQVDDTIDEQSATRELPRRLAQLHSRLNDVYAGRPRNSPVDRLFAGVVERFEIPESVPRALLEGMEWDSTGRRYETLDEVIDYSARVAGTVGIMMSLLMGERRASVVARACDLGLAMQLTNIARDIGEDAHNGRVYIPEIWLREVGLDRDDFLARPAFDGRLGILTERLLQHADSYYRRAEEGTWQLPWNCRPAIRAAALIYSDIGRVIRSAGFDSVSQRAIVSTARKFWLVVQSSRFLFGSKNPLSGEPPAQQTLFLVNAVAGDAPP